MALPRLLGLPVLAGWRSCLWGRRPWARCKSRGRQSPGMSVGLGWGPAGMVVNLRVWLHPFPGTHSKLCPLLSCRLESAGGFLGKCLTSISSPPASLLGYRCHPPSPHGLPGHLPVEPSRSVTIPGVGCQYPRAPLKPSKGILMGMFGGGDPLSLRDMSSLPMDGVSPGQRQEGSVCLEPEPHHIGVHNGVPMVGKVVSLVSAGRNGSGTCLQLLAWPLFPWDDGLCPPSSSPALSS